MKKVINMIRRDKGGVMREFTIEITNKCFTECSYCSSDAHENSDDFLTVNTILSVLSKHGPFKVLHISGGEPLAHPDFYTIIRIAYDWAENVIVHTNLITHIAFNPNVIDGIYVEAYLNLPGTTDSVRILKRVEQGREARKPKISCSKNWEENCTCEHKVLTAKGQIANSPCNKEAQ